MWSPGSGRDVLAETGFRHAIDRLALRGRRLFGWGWVADQGQAIESLALTVAGEGWQRKLPVTYGLARPDVAAAWPGLPGSGASGFVVTGYVDTPAVRSIMLELRYAGGEARTIDVTLAAERDATGRSRRIRSLRYLAGALARRLGRGDLRGIVRRAAAQNYHASSLDEGSVLRALIARLGGAARIVIVFDHNMGGGANVYRRTVIADRVAAGAEVLLCTFNFPTLDYRVEHFAPARRAGHTEERTEVAGIYRARSYLALEPVLEAVAVDELFVNSVVSFDEPLPFAEWLTGLRSAKPELRLTIAVNDYFAVCPSFTLINDRGRYCGIPALSECERCLASHRASWMALSPPSTIGPWRAIWGRCLATADEVRCFSESSRGLLLRAWPGFAEAKLSLVPHRVDYTPKRLPSIDRQGPLAIAVVGQISVQKGAEVVRDLVARADRERLPLRVVVIGTLDLCVDSKRLTVTGPYRREDLVDLIEAHRINMVLFPSICPETFSYVVEELMRLALPIVAFDRGAPGERLRRYPQARLCREADPGAALEAMIAWHREWAGADAPRSPSRVESSQ